MKKLTKIVNGLKALLICAGKHIYKAVKAYQQKIEADKAHQAMVQEIEQNRLNYEAYAVWLQNWLRNRANNFGIETPANPINLMMTNIYQEEIVSEFAFSVRDESIIGNDLIRVDALRDYITQDLHREFVNCGATEIKVTRVSHGVEIRFINPAILQCDYMVFDSTQCQIIVYNSQQQYKFAVSEKQPFYILDRGEWKSIVFTLNIAENGCRYMRIPALNYAEWVMPNQTPRFIIGRYHIMQTDRR